MSTGIHIGANEVTVQAARTAVMNILESGQDQKTIRAALKTFTVICNVNHSTISNCTINMADIPTDE